MSGKEPMSEELFGEYNAAIGSLVAARGLYETACSAHGPGSEPALQAHDHLEREVERRDKMRVRYDAASRAHLS